MFTNPQQQAQFAADGRVTAVKIAMTDEIRRLQAYAADLERELASIKAVKDRALAQAQDLVQQRNRWKEVVRTLRDQEAPQVSNDQIIAIYRQIKLAAE